MYIEHGDWQHHSAHAWVGDTDPGHILVLQDLSFLASSLSREQLRAKGLSLMTLGASEGYHESLHT